MFGHDCMVYSFGEDNGGMAEPLMEDQLSLGSSFMRDHEFPRNYDLDEDATDRGYKGATSVKEVWLACMKKGVEIMKVYLSTISVRKRSCFEKMEPDMVNLDDE
ncbi:hypothetical protein D1007_23362 [Hordeum vulgare]|nr:hypothetical protein D1007_23362 [Hordeum vulgare]